MSRVDEIFAKKPFTQYDTCKSGKCSNKKGEILISPIMLSNVNPDSGYFNPGSPYARMNVYKLFVSEANVQYISKLIMHELTQFPIKDIGCNIPEMMFRYKRIKTGEIEEESTNYNPVLELAFRNYEFVKETLKNILIRNEPPKGSALHQNFLLAYQNINDFYFREINWGTRYKHLGDVKARNVYRHGNRIPPDRVSAHQRHYERDITDSLRSRQLENQIHGYDMSDFADSTFKTPSGCNPYTRY